MAITNFASNKVMDYLFGGISFTPPVTYYMGFSTTTISTNGSNVSEPVGGGYARIPITNNKTQFTYSSSGCVTNGSTILFAETSGSLGTITTVALWDSLTSGSIWTYGNLSVPKIVQSETTVNFSASSIALGLH